MTEFTVAETRQAILDIIGKHPGIYCSKIAESLNLKFTLVQEVLHDLEETYKIYSVETEGFKRYYIKEVPPKILDRRISQTRKKIIEVITNNPGLHQSKIAETLNMRLSLAEYHLRQMEQENIIFAVKDVGYYKRYYITGSEAGAKERIIISLLREKIPLKIVLFLFKHPNAKHKEILQNFNISSSTLTYHLTKLVQYEIIEIPSYGEEKGYLITNKQKLFCLMKKYRLIPLTTSFIDIWDDLKFK